MDSSRSPDIESTPPPAVSSLRSRFEQLAAETAATAAAKRPSSTYGLLTPDPPSPRPRASSGFSDPKPDAQSLRPASSASDLKASAKRPPPPPPGRSSRAPSPAPRQSSPLLRPVPVADPSSSPLIHPSSSPLVNEVSLPSIPRAVSPSKQASLSRKPPPPPPPPVHHDTKPEVPATDVSSLISKFANGSTPLSSPSLPAKPPLPPNRGHSHVSSSVSVTSSSVVFVETAAPSRTRRPSPTSDAGYLASSSSFASASSDSLSSRDPFGSDISDLESDSSDSEGTVAGDPPPLPSRRSALNGYAHQEVASPDQEPYLDSSASSSVSDVSVAHLPSPAAHLAPYSRPFVPPPRPPPRHKASAASSTASSASPPPPLPARKTTAPTAEEPPRRGPFRSLHESDMHLHSHLHMPPGLSASVSPTTERKTFGSHPPPPTRTIGLGDRLPPPRRNAPSGSSSEEEEEELKKVELLPDASRASRRPPTVDCFNYSEFNIHVPAYTSSVAVCGRTVAVAHTHRVKVYNLAVSEAPVIDIDTNHIGLEKLNGFKVTAMDFRTAEHETERGAYLWLGTKDGMLVELDVRAGTVTGIKATAHAHTVTHILRHGRAMVTLDDTGKVLVFSPDVEGAELQLSLASPRVVRIAEKQEFARILGGQLWTSMRDSGGGASTSRGPIVRVYDVFSPGSTGRSLLPTEHLGAVTAGTVLPTQPGHVYLAHEGGHVSVWALETHDGVPLCEEVVKVSTSDVLSLEGVSDRLWAGGRSGAVSAYDVVPRPWLVTNSWQAHTKLPALKIAVDPWSIEKLGRLTVYSIGRDERLRFWDGLLGMDWVDHALMKRESEFSSFRNINVLVVSWNLDSAKPDVLTGPENANFLHEALTSVADPDIIAFGFQELIDLESRKMAAKTVLLGGKKKNEDGGISQKVSTSYKKWYDRLVLAVKQAMPPDVPYTVIHTENLVGLFSCIFVKNTERISLKQVAITTIKRGMGGRYGNKGGIVARFVIDDTSICFINCHLAAGQHHVRQRNADVAAMLEEKSVFPESDAVEEPLAYVNGGDGSMVLDHEMVFMNGDMNYRIDQRREAVVTAVKAGELESLLAHDQLNKEMKFNRAFRLRSFAEGPITFAPTYKYDRRSSEYDTSEKARVPAWCDRVLWRSREPSRVEQLHYQRYEANVSDHRPISAGFRMTVKAVQHEARARIRADVHAAWKAHEQNLLHAAQTFYVEQAMV